MLVQRGPCRQYHQLAIDLHAVRIDDFAIQPCGNFERHPRFATCRGTGDKHNFGPAQVNHAAIIEQFRKGDKPMAEEEKSGITPEYVPPAEEGANAGVISFEATQGIARLTPVHLELVVAVLKRAGAIGLKPKWLEQHKRAQLKFEGLPSDQVVELASAAVLGSGLKIEVASAA